MLLIKIGGGKGVNWEYIAEDLNTILKKEQVIIVHGANAYRDEVAKDLHYETKKITSPSGILSTFTDAKAIDIFLMSYAGLVNKKIVAILQKHEINAVGLSGVDGKLWQAVHKKNLYVLENGKTKLLQGSYTGKVEKINTKLLELLLDSGYTPVICPPAISYEGEIVNTDNDSAVAKMVEALQIETVVSLFEAPGMLKNYQEESSAIHKIKKDELESYFEYAHGTMKKKLLGAQKAFEYGLKTMYWSDGRIKNPITSALQGKGTVIS